MASVRNRWQQAANEFGLGLEDLFNSGIRDTVKTGLRALVANTQHDSSRAANHWVVVPNRGNKNPGQWAQSTFNPVYGQPPVGKPGDKGANRQATIESVMQRESRRSIDATVKGRSGQATAFIFVSSVPETWNDIEGNETPPGNEQRYRENARLEEAKLAAETQMQSKWLQFVEKGKYRKTPLR